MRILIATNMYPTPDTPWYGVFVQQQEVSLRRLGVEVDVAAHLGRPSRRAYLNGLFDLIRRLRTEQYDLIHSHHTYSTVLAILARRVAGLTNPRVRRLPIVETFHESEVFHRGTEYGQDALRRLRYSHGIKVWALRRVDFALPVQREMLGRVLSPAEAGRLRSRIIPAGIDLAQFQPEPKEAARARLGWDPAGLYVFFPCDPGKPEKRHDLARAGFDLFASRLKEDQPRQPPARFIVGGGIPYERMPDTLKASDIILVPTDYEASPTVVKEALACERPVVSTDVGDVRECYSGLPGVFICDWTPEDVATQLNQALAAPVPYGGRARLAELELDLDQVARRLLAVYEEVLASPQAPHK